MLTVLVKRLTTSAIMPRKATPGSACFDLHVDRREMDTFGWSINTGLAVSLPAGHGMLIYPRSGLATKLGLVLRNGTGVIDSDYRGEIILKFNFGHPSMQDFVLSAFMLGSRVAQAMIIQVPEVVMHEVTELDETERSVGGFGSTGT